MSLNSYFESLNDEMMGLRDRVRNFIKGQHWLTDGEWKESVLRSILRRNLPSHLAVGRGFVICPSGPSRQLDVIIYDSTLPILFRDGDLVFITPDAVVAVIEVKSRISPRGLRRAAKKLAHNAYQIRDGSGSGNFFGLFAFESTICKTKAAEIVPDACAACETRIIDLFCLGDSRLIRWWNTDPSNLERPSKWPPRWHSYELKKRAFGYFLHTIMEFVNSESVNNNRRSWFPDDQESFKDDEIQFKRTLSKSP